MPMPGTCARRTSAGLREQNRRPGSARLGDDFPSRAAVSSLAERNRSLLFECVGEGGVRDSYATLFCGLDVHKQLIAFCVKTADGEVMAEGTIPATRGALNEWVRTVPGPWHGAMEATMFSQWIYHHLKPHAAQLQMGHAARMKAISAGKKSGDRPVSDRRLLD